MRLTLGYIVSFLMMTAITFSVILVAGIAMYLFYWGVIFEFPRYDLDLIRSLIYVNAGFSLMVGLNFIMSDEGRKKAYELSNKMKR